ncbi:MAG: HAMP domain-containing protein [Chloroflexi bacterium]|nr:HAMP domain-containing protein [Chloroflexota bacterium]
MNQSLRSRLTGIFLLVAVIPLLIASIAINVISFQAQQTNAITEQDQLATTVAQQINRIIEENGENLEETTRLLAIEQQPVEEQEAILGSLLTYENAFEEIALVTAEGQELARVSRQAAVVDDLRSRSDDSAFRSVLDRRDTIVGEVEFDDNTGEPLVTISTPVRDLRTGEITHVLMGDLRIKIIWDLIAGLDIGENDLVYVLDATDQVVAHPDPSVVLADTRFAFPEAVSIGQGLNGERVVFGHEEITAGDQTFQVVAETPTRQALAEANTNIVIAAVITLGALAVAFLAGIFVSRQISEPVTELADAAYAFSQGDLHRRVSVNTQDEIGALATTFNAMAGRLQETLEAERVARREAEDANRAKDLFLATMSHELRTPLNAILGFLGLMAFSEQLDEDNLHMAERSISNAERLLSLINNILDLSRLSVGRLQITPVEMSPKQMARQIQSDMGLRFKEKGLNFVVQIDQTLPDQVIHDEERIVQIATNLVGNALKFTDEGEIRMSLKRRDDRMVLEVADTGIGIPHAKQALIFDEFVQADNSSTRKHGGAGLGLSIVKRLTVLMDGTIELRSEPGVGSTFTVELPLELKRASADEARQAASEGA